MPTYPMPSPEPLEPQSSLKSHQGWVKRAFRWDCLDSTNEAAFRALDAGCALDGDSFLALEQMEGRGRRGQKWRSAPGGGLYVSFVIRPRMPWPGPLVTVAAGLASKDAVEALGLENSRLKWPNDLLVGESKLAGVLVESRSWSVPDPVYVLGVGINVVQTAFPDALTAERPVVSLAQLGLATDLKAVESALFKSLSERLHQAKVAPESLGRDFLRALDFGACPVTVEVASETLTGPLIGMDFTRGLEISLDGDSTRTIPLEHIRSVGQEPPGDCGI